MDFQVYLGLRRKGQKMKSKRRKCTECGEMLADDKLLKAHNPFHTKYKIWVCERGGFFT